MFDARIRPLIDPPLNAIGRGIANRGISADQVTLFGFALGIAGALAIALGASMAGLFFIAAGRIADGLDGAVARATKTTDRGGFLDIALDFIFYAAVPLAFAWADPARNALPAACLLAAFYANGAVFLAFALMAERRGIVTSAQGQKSLYYMAGVAEGAETIAVFLAMCLWPAWFPVLAYVFAGICMLSAAARLGIGWKMLGDPR